MTVTAPPAVALVSLSDLRALLAEVTTPDPRPALLDRAALAHELSISTPTLDRLIADGLPSVRVGCMRRFALADVLSWLRGRTGDAEETNRRAVPQPR